MLRIRCPVPSVRVVLLALTLAPKADADPASRVFSTRDEAVRTLIKPQGNGAPVTIGVDPFPPFDPSTNCELGVLPSQLSDSGFTGVIGQNLSRHCDDPSNIVNGSILGAGIGSLGATRTVSQPDLERDRQPFSEGEAPDPPPPAPAGLNFAEGASVFRNATPDDPPPSLSIWSGDDDWAFFTEVAYVDVDADGTAFSSAFDVDGIEMRLGVLHQRTPSTRVGLLFDVAKLSGRLRSAPDLVENDALINSTPAFVPYRDVCGTDPVGDLEQDAIAGTVFADTRLRSGATLSYYATLAWQEESYDTSACYTSEVDSGPNDFAEIFAGRLTGERESRSITAGVQLDRSYRFGRTTLTPNVSFAAKHTRVPAYSESERAVDGATAFTTQVGGGIVPTGTALAFDAQSINAAQARLGFDARLRAGQATTILLDAALVRELGDGQPRVTAHFLEDGRAEPLSFSFLGAPIDRSYIELGAGVATRIAPNAVLGLRGETILKHDYVREVKVTLQMSLRF